MIDHPRLARTDDGEPAVVATLDPTGGYNFDQPSRETLTLSTRAVGLLLDDLEYTDREEIAPVTTRVLILTGGANAPDESSDVVSLCKRLRCPEGGKHLTEREITRLARYLKRSEIDERARWLVAELVEGSELATVMDTSEIKTRRERVNGLRGIAKDLS